MSASDKFFIGARVLSEEDVKGVLPNYESVFEEIENMREVAKEYRAYDAKTRKAVMNRRQMNNAITILGQRGTGKTSVLFTILDRLEKNESGDLIFEPIEPVAISQEGDIIGCILSLLNEKMNRIFDLMKEKGGELSDTVKNIYFKDCIFKRGNPLQESFDRLLEYYLYLDPQYRQLLVKNFTDLNSYVKKSSLVLSADTEFQGRFLEFLDMFLDHYKMIKGFGAEKEPLMYFVLDDIDLCPERSSQLLHMIIKYMKHPNVVCFLAGDLETMQYELQLDFIRKENIGGIITNGMSETYETQNNYFERLYQRKERLAEDTLVKILPAPRRFYLNMWTNGTKPFFGNIKLGEKKMNFGELFHEIIQFCEEKDSGFFFLNIKNVKNGTVGIAFSMFGTHSRELWNVEVSAIRLLEALQDEVKKEERIIATIQNLLESILMSSSTLRKYIGEHLERYIIFGKSRKKSAVLWKNIEDVIRETCRAVVGKMPTDEPLNSILHYFYLACMLLGVSYEEKSLIQKMFLENSIPKNHREFVSYIDEWELECENFMDFYLVDFLANMPFRYFTVCCTNVEQQKLLDFDEEDDVLVKLVVLIYQLIRQLGEVEDCFKLLHNCTKECTVWEKIEEYYSYENIYSRMTNFIWLDSKLPGGTESKLEVKLEQEFNTIGLELKSVPFMYQNHNEIRTLFMEHVFKEDVALYDYGSGVAEQLCKKDGKSFIGKAKHYLKEYKKIVIEYLQELREEEESELFSQERIRLFLLLNLYTTPDLYNEPLYQVKEWLDHVQED